MDKIILSDREKQILEAQLKGGVGFEPETDEEKEVLSKLIDQADALIRELDDWDNLNGDLLAWYYNKYKEQNITQ